jgi:deoxyribodipyrimidine photo-lyase
MDTHKRPVIYWFRQDLRLTDLPGLQAAVATGRPVLPCYIYDTETPGAWAPGAASRWWLHHSLASLSSDIAALGGELLIRRGSAANCLQELAEEIDAAAIHCSRAYEPWAANLERTLHEGCQPRGRDFRRFGGSLLFEPENIHNQAGKPFKVFTPFWKNCLQQVEPLPPVMLDPEIRFCASGAGLALEDLGLLPRDPDWASHWTDLWQPGEAGAQQRLAVFLAQGIQDYSEGRNHPSRETTSRLSPHIHFGEISPRQIWHAARKAAASGPELEQQADKFLSEMGWREFSAHLLFHFPTLPEAPFKPHFEKFPWLGSPAALEAWQKGQTGYPIVDAGMRELWQTGYMHNRVRMIVASFLTKHLLIPWRAGENWFWDTLVDADLASNASGWQWVAGSGADASPYFRIFNPTLQGERFDADGDYVRRWVPELAGLPNRYLHQPEAAPAQVLADAGVEPGVDYPLPLVNHKEAREAALAAYGSIRDA